MAVHITKIYSVAFCHLHNIIRTREYLSTDGAVTLIHFFVCSRIDYCNSLLYGVPMYRLGKLQRRHNVAARLVVSRGKLCLITPVLHQLHWLTALFRINFKSLLIAFKAIHGLAPYYISNLVKIKPLNSRFNLRSNNETLLSHPNVKTLATLGNRAFVASAHKLWNSLPLEISMAKSVDSLKDNLKTYLFGMAYLP